MTADRAAVCDFSPVRGSEELGRRNLVQGLNLLRSRRRHGKLGIVDDADEALIGAAGNVDRQRLLVKGIDVAADHGSEQTIKRTVLVVRRRKLQGFLLK